MTSAGLVYAKLIYAGLVYKIARRHPPSGASPIPRIDHSRTTNRHPTQGKPCRANPALETVARTVAHHDRIEEPVTHRHDTPHGVGLSLVQFHLLSLVLNPFELPKDLVAFAAHPGHNPVPPNPVIATTGHGTGIDIHEIGKFRTGN